MIALPTMAQSTEPTADPTITPGASRNPVPNPPLRSPRSEHNRNSTPSISPLSTTSRAHNEYFASTDHARQSPIQEPTVIQTPLSTGDIHVPDVEMRDHDDNDDDDDDDDRSSSLSDFEAEFEDKENNNTHDDKDARPEDADSEAETERLERTPQKLPKSTTETGRTPSKLNQETSMGADLSDAMSSPRSPLRDPQSPSPTQRFKRAPSYSSTPAAAARLTRKPSASPSALGTQHAGDKRKRFTPTSSGDSPLTSDAESDSEELDATNHTNGKASTQHKATGDVAHDRVDAPNDELGMPESARETPEPDEIDENPYISPMKAARLKGKKERAKRQKETPVVQKSDYEAEYDETMEIDELADDDESAAKSEEDRESKKQAHAEYLALAEKFHIFRTKLQAEKLAAAEEELEQLTRPRPDHAIYLAQLQAITQRCETKIRQEHALQFYKMQALANQTLAERAQLHTQFYQESRESRDRHLEYLGKMWYEIQKERRSQLQPDEAERYVYKYATKYSDQIRNQANYNREVSILSGMQKYVGFPAAPEINGTRINELDDDLKAMKIPRQQTNHAVQQPTTYPNHVDMNGMAARAAQERWVEQNPWANAQHPSHQQSRTPAPYPPYNFHNPPQSNPAVNLFPQASAQPRTNSPFSTPLPPQKRADYHTNGLGSGETIGVPSDPPSSAAQAQTTVDKAYPSRANDDGSPIDSIKVRAAIANPLLTRDDRRNFSNISSASTIDAPNDSSGGPDLDRPHHLYAGLAHGPVPPSLPTSSSASQHPFSTGALHAQNIKHDDRRPELYDSVNFRPAIGAYGPPIPMFGNGSPIRPEKQRAT